MGRSLTCFSNNDKNNHFSSKESIPKELLDAFKGSDPGKKGVIPAKDLWNILTKWGEKISPREGKTLCSVWGKPKIEAVITLNLFVKVYLGLG